MHIDKSRPKVIEELTLTKSIPVLNSGHCEERQRRGNLNKKVKLH